MSADAGGLGLLIGKVTSSNVQRSIAKQQEERVNNGGGAVPNVKCSLVNPLPKGLDCKNIHVAVSVELEKTDESEKKRDEMENLAKTTADLLQNQLASKYTCTAENKALAILEVKVISISQGNKWNRFLKNDYGFVKLGVSFVLRESGHQILKHGRIGYADSLKDASIRERCESGKVVLETKLVPMTVTQLIKSVGIEE